MRQGLTVVVCDPSPYSSFEEQWGAQLGAEQERLAEQDHDEDMAELERQQFLELLDDPDAEATLGPRDDRTLDRIDSRGNYEPGNIRWATYSEQNDNRLCGRCRQHGHNTTTCTT